MIILIINTELCSQFIGVYTVILFLVLCEMFCVPALFVIFKLLLLCVCLISMWGCMS